MEGRILWYKPGTGWGRLLSDTGKPFSFKAADSDGVIHGGANVEFKVSEWDGNLIGVNPRVLLSGVETLLRENADLARELHSAVSFET